MKFKTRLIIATAMLFIFNLLLVLFFLYRINYISQLLLALLFTVIGYVVMYRIKVESKKKFFNFFILILGVYVLTLYFANFHYLNITSDIYYAKIAHKEYSLDKFWYSDHITIQNQGSSKVVFIQNGEPDLYLYHLENEIDDIEVIIPTGDIEIKSIHLVIDKVIFTSIRTEGNLVYTDIFELDSEAETYSLLNSFDGEFDVYFHLGDIFLVEVDFMGFYSKVYQVIDGALIVDAVVNYDIYNMEFINGSWFVVLQHEDGMSAIIFAKCNDDFSIDETIISELYDFPSIKNGFQHILVFDTKTTYFIDSVDLSYQEYEGLVQYNGYNGYLYRDRLYDYDMNQLSDFIYINDDYHTYGGNLAFSHENGMVVFDIPKIVQVHQVGREPSMFIHTYWRHFFGFISIFGIAFSITFGLYVEPKPKLMTVIYHTNKVACPNCKSYNNIVTYPEKCLYCNTVFTKK